MHSSLRRLLVALAALLVTISPLPGDQLFDNGVPDLMEGSELTHWREAERFALTEGVIIGAVRFWDFEAVPGAFAGSFLWEIRANGPANRPGAVLHTGTSSNLSRVATGRRALFLNWPEFVNTFEIPAVALPPGTYWLVLHNGPLSNNVGQNLFWEGAINPSTDPSMNDIAPFVNNWRSNSSSGTPLSKLAFQLFGIPESARPRITTVDRTGSVPRIRFTSRSGQTYRVEYKNALSDESWNAVAGAESIAGTGSEIEVADPDPNASALARRFYRVTLHAPPPPPPLLPRAGPRPATEDRRPRGQAAPENSLRRHLPAIVGSQR
jgi:hypothetical protein